MKLPPSFPKAPESLIEIQDWFAQAIMAQEPNRSALKTAAKTHLTQSQTLNQIERFNIYVNDFWPRCLDSLSEDFPGLKKYWGPKPFKKIMKTYLSHYPSRSFTLFHLPQDLIKFLDQNYQEQDRKIVLEMARYEWAKVKAYFTKHKKPLNPKTLSDTQKAQLTTTPLTFQDHLELIESSVNLLAWVDGDHQQLGRPKKDYSYSVIYQLNGQAKVDGIDKARYTLIKEGRKKQSLEVAIDAAMAQLNKADQEKIEKNIEAYFNEWQEKGWICHPEGA